MVSVVEEREIVATSDAEILGTVLASIQRLADEMDADLDSPGPWSKDAWIRAYDGRMRYLRRVLKWADTRGGEQ